MKEIPHLKIVQIDLTDDLNDPLVNPAAEGESAVKEGPQTAQAATPPAPGTAIEQSELTPESTDSLPSSIEDPTDGVLHLSVPAELTESSADTALSISQEVPAESADVAMIAPQEVSSPAAVGGIDILVQMAHRGEIDPKNIDIIDVTDRFLQAIAARPKENLRQSGKILFHASVLLRMKAEALLISFDDAENAGDDFLEFDSDGSPIIYDSRNEIIARQITLHDLERALARRSHAKQTRQRRVTLEQLIEALRDAERLENHRLQRRTEPRIDLEGHQQVNDVEDIWELAHDEDIESVIDKVEQIIADTLKFGDLMPLVALVQQLKGRGDWVDAFLAVLFLSNSGRIVLEQEEFYGPLYLTLAEQQAIAS